MEYHLLEQNCVSISIFCIVRKTHPLLLLLVGFMSRREAGRQAGRQADEIQVDFELSKFSAG